MSATEHAGACFLAALYPGVWCVAQLFTGAWSDRAGRKPLIVGGCALAALLYFPIFQGLTHYANPTLEAAQQRAPVQVIADAQQCSFQFNPVGAAAFRSSCDIAKAVLARHSVSYDNLDAAPGSVARVRIGAVEISSFEGSALDQAAFKQRSAAQREPERKGSCVNLDHRHRLGIRPRFNLAGHDLNRLIIQRQSQRLRPSPYGVPPCQAMPHDDFARQPKIGRVERLIGAWISQHSFGMDTRFMHESA